MSRCRTRSCSTSAAERALARAGVPPAPRPEARLPLGRRDRAGPGLLRPGALAIPIRRGGRTRPPGPDRGGDYLGAGAARGPARPRPVVAGRLRGRLARADGPGPGAARAADRRQVPGPLADKRAVAGRGLAAAGGVDEPAGGSTLGLA